MPIPTEKIKELREKRAKLVHEAQALLAKDELSSEDEAKFDQLMEEADKLKVRIDREERALAAVQDLEEPEPIMAGRMDQRVAHPSPHADGESVEDAFVAYLRFGERGLSPEQMEIMRARWSPEIRGAQTVGTDAAGGYLVPEGFRRQLEEAMQAYGGMREAATIIRTASGNDLLWPTTDDTNNKGAILAEAAAMTEQDVAFGQVTLKAYTYTSKLVKVSVQLLQDSAFDLPGSLSRWLGARIARATNEHFTTGTGVDQPTGIVTAASEGKVAPAGQTDSVTYDDLVDLEHSVDPAYRRAGAKWMFHDDTLKVLKKLKDGDGRPLWLPGVAVREPDTILGYPYVINQDMPTLAAGAKAILFGDLSKYVIREVLGIQLVRFEEAFMQNLLKGFAAYARYDGALVDAGANPVKYFQTAAA